jgi:hypothetical protein
MKESERANLCEIASKAIPCFTSTRRLWRGFYCGLRKNENTFLSFDQFQNAAF